VDRPALTVIVPVRRDPENLARCLESLRRASHPRCEVVVVDDASGDSTPEVALRHGARLLRQEHRTGPAAARNRGAEAASHPWLYFLDADVAVAPDTLDRVAAHIEEDPSRAAFFGSYDAEPAAPGLVSQYRNLLHHYVHQSGNREASTFWSGCGVVRKSVFLELGGFDTSYGSASIEDIELGARLRAAGHRVELMKDLQVRHLKRWSLWSMVRADVARRGIPWTLLILREGKFPNDLNLRYGQRLSVALTGTLVAALAALPWLAGAARPAAGWIARGCLVGVVLLNLPFFRFLRRRRGPGFALASVPLHLLYFLCSGVAFGAGLLIHWGRSSIGRWGRSNARARRRSD
jgi:GT2 family glycosyltransferase